MSKNVKSTSILLCTGIIKLRRSPPPRLRGPQYVLNITATDDNASGGPFPLSSSAQVIVGINDINNNKPVFEEVTEITHYYSELNESSLAHVRCCDCGICALSVKTTVWMQLCWRTSRRGRLSWEFRPVTLTWGLTERSNTASCTGTVCRLGLTSILTLVSSHLM